MDSRFSVGDNVIGLESWASSQPQVGEVLLTDLKDIDPLHDLLINTSDKKVIVRDSSDYQNRSATLQNTTTILTSRLTARFSPETQQSLNKLLTLLESRLGNKMLNREEEIYRFFHYSTNVTALRRRVYWHVTSRFLSRHVENFFCGTFDLIIGDLLRFYLIRLRIGRLGQEIEVEQEKLNNAEWYDRFLPNDSEPLVNQHNRRISDLKKEIEELKQQKAEISRAFIAIAIATASLILSILNALSNSK